MVEISVFDEPLELKIIRDAIADPAIAVLGEPYERIVLLHPPSRPPSSSASITERQADVATAPAC